MVSASNFYWILYHHLLRPSGIDCYYYYPFGTQQNLIKLPTWNNYAHVLFHFDQEPLYENNLGQLYNSKKHFRYNYISILANSEKSSLKQEVCRSYIMSDWYYFYHGFAALHWYNDARYIYDHGVPEKHFCSYSNLVTRNRCYRMALTARFFEHRIQNKGDISFQGSKEDCINELNYGYSELPNQDQQSIKKFLLNGIELPLILDKNRITGDDSAHYGYQTHALWQHSFLHLVNETVFFQKKLHLTEKTFKPIVAMRPFILVAAPGNLQYLKNYGFRTFDTWIDESYDQIQDPWERLSAIVKEVTKICDLSHQQLIDMHEDMKPVLEYNKQHFFNEFKTMIINELVTNYETVLRVWNNGRVDERLYPINPNLEAVKKLLWE